MRQRRVFGPSWEFRHPKLQIVSIVCTLGFLVLGIPGNVDDTETWFRWLKLPAGVDGLTTAHWIFLSLACVFFVGLITVNVLPFMTKPSKRTRSKKQRASFGSPSPVEELQEIELLLESADNVKSVPNVDKRIEIEGWRVESFTRFTKINQKEMAGKFGPCLRFSGIEYLDWAVTLLRQRQSILRGIIRAHADPSNEKLQRAEQEQDQNEKFELGLEIKPRDGHLQVTAKVVNHSLFSIQIARVVFYCPPERTITMKHRDTRSGEVKSKAALPFHYITWDPGSAEDVRLMSPNELKIDATTATGATETINGEQIKAATLDALERSH